MTFDFATILFLLSLLTGLIWAFDAWFMAPKRRQTAERANAANQGSQLELPKVTVKDPTLVEYAKSFFPVIVAVLLLRSFLMEPFRIPSGSMIPTLQIGDFILVNKFAYGIRIPVINKKIISTSAPKRGDIIVFRYPRDPSVDYIKRVIGIAGDKIAYRNKVLYINGVEAKQEMISEFTDNGIGKTIVGGYQRLETLNGVVHKLEINPEIASGEFEYVVPAGEFFVMGDNRDNSNDSRVWGTVPEENLVGKAFLVWMSWNSSANWLESIRWSRIGTSIN